MNNTEALVETRLFERSRHGFCIIEMLYDADGAARDYVFLTANPMFEAHSGLKDVVGRSILELVPNSERFWIDAFDRVARSGEPQVLEQDSPALGRVFEVEAMRVGDAGERKVAVIFSDVTQRRTLEADLSDLSERNVYQLELTDALRLLETPDALLGVAAKLLKAKLGVSRVAYSEVDVGDEFLTTYEEFNDGMPSVVGQHRMEDYGPLVIGQLRNGRTLIINDTATDERFTPREQAAYLAYGVRANISHPVFQGTRFAALLSVQQNTPRAWTANELAMVAETAERTALALARLRVERRIFENEARLQRALEASRAGSWEYDSKTRELIYDGIYGPLLGLAPGPGRISGSLLETYSCEEDRLKALEIVRRAMRDGPGAQFQTEYRLRVPGQPERWLSSRGVVETGLDGALRLIGTVMDITERHALEDAARTTLERLELAMEAGGIGLWDWQLETDELQWSAEQERIYGLAQGTFSGRSAEFMAFMHPEDRERSLQNMALLREGKDIKMEFRIILASGDVRWIYAISRPTLNEAGQLVRTTGANIDVTEIKRAEQRLIEVNEAQRRFVSDAAHELRAPLTGIRGNLSLIARYPDMPIEDRVEAAQESEREVGRLTRLIADLLATARGQRPESQFLEEIRLERVLLEAWRGARSLSERRRFDLGALEACLASGDPDALKQLVLSLLENAVKYTPDDGTVRLELRVVDGFAQITVSDTGAGIEPEDLPKVFERFYRTDRARSRLNGPAGTGLGLTIAKQIVERHGGTIWLESELGVGTSAFVRLPLIGDPAASSVVEHQPSVAI